MIICVCRRINDEQVRKAIADHDVRTYEELKTVIPIGMHCGACREAATNLLKDTVAGECDGST